LIIDYVRHGLSEANIKQLVTGDKFDPLSSEGRGQVMALANWIAPRIYLYQGYYCSPWKRAHETALMISPEISWVIDNRLGETDGGHIANWTRERFYKEYPGFYESPVNEYLGGESHAQLKKRVLEMLGSVLCAFEDVSDKAPTLFDEKRVLVVAHAGPIACALHEVLGLKMDAFPALMPHNATITSIKYTDADVAKGQVISMGAGPYLL
jgi:broad specificity phosphatase PhoE